MAPSTTTTSLSRSDRVGMYLTVALCVIAAVVVSWSVLQRIAEVAPGTDIPVLLPFVGETAALPIGPGRDPVDVAVDQAVVTVSDPAPATFFALIAEPVVVGLTTVGAILLLCLFCVNLARGRAFSSSTVAIVFTATGVLIAGWVFGSLFRTMAVNGTLATVSEGSYEGVLFEADFAPLFGMLALAAVGAAFQIGHRLQRETEGLV